MAILTVGSGRQYASLAAAIAASSDGDTIQVDAGTYTDDFVTIATKIHLVGIGGMVRLVATQPPPSGAILVTRNDVAIDHFEITGAAAAAGNGAAIRQE